LENSKGFKFYIIKYVSYLILFHPDFTVGLGVSPSQPYFHMGRGLYRRSGISPCPED